MPERLRQRSAVSYVALEEPWVEDDEVLPPQEEQEVVAVEGEVRAARGGEVIQGAVSERPCSQCRIRRCAQFAERWGRSCCATPVHGCTISRV